MVFLRTWALYGHVLSDFVGLGRRQGEGQSVDDVVNKIYALAGEVPDAELFVVTPPMIPGYGMGNGFELYLQDKSAGDINVFKEISNEFVAALNERPEIEMAYSAFDTSYPQYWVDIDAAQCERAGISTAEVLETLSGYYGGGYVSNFNHFRVVEPFLCTCRR